MTLAEIKAMDKDVLLPAEAAGPLGCNPHYIRVAAKKRPELLGSPVDVAREMGYYPKPSSGDRWAQEHDVPAVRLGARKRGYETDLVAKAIVQSRGMV